MKAVISDFGGVLTTPLAGAFAAVEEASGFTFEELVTAMKAIWDRDGEHPLFDLERGRMSEVEFTGLLAEELRAEGASRQKIERFSEVFFSGLQPNDRMIELMRELGEDRRMALLTNNVKEWGPYWRSMAPIDELFEIVVDSAYVGCRKPEPEIYTLTLQELELEPQDCLFIDDVDINCRAAEELGIHVVHFRDTDQAISEVHELLGNVRVN